MFVFILFDPNVLLFVNGVSLMQIIFLIMYIFKKYQNTTALIEIQYTDTHI